MKRVSGVFVAMLGVVAMVAIAADAVDGKALYESKCASCHGKDGKGQTTMGKKKGCKDLTDSKVQAAFTDDQAFKNIKEGMKKGEDVLMKPYGDTMSDDEIKAVVKYCRTFAEAAK